MSKVLITKSKLDTLAEAVSAKSHESVPLTIDEMTSAVLSIPVDKQNKTVTPTENTQSITADTGFFGLETVTVNPIPSQYIVPEGAITITTNGTGINVSEYATATVNVPTGSTINNQSKTVTPTETRQYATPDAGYTGLSQVIVEPISSTYVGSGITTRTSTDLTVSGATVTVPTGYYSENFSKAVTTAVQATPTISVNTSTGEITATSTQSAGYVAAGTQTATEQLSIQAAATITPNNTSQTAVAANKYTTGAITVAAVPIETKSITANGTYTPATGKYFSSVTVNVPTVNVSQDQDGYIVIDDDGNYGGGGGSVVDVLTGAFPTGEIDISGLTLSAYCGAYRTGITKITGTGVTATTGRNFQGCTGVTDIHVHFTSTNSADIFSQCTNLKTAVVIVDGTNQAQGYFNGCTKLETADLTMSRFRNNTFYNNQKLTKIILRQTTPTTMEVANLLNFTPFKSGGTGGEIYIPKALYDHLGDGTALDYKSATNWSTYDGYGTITWKKIEGSIYETQYADGTPIE